MINEEKIFYDSTDGIRLCGLLSVMNKSKNIVVLLHGLNGNKEEMNCFNVAVQQLQNKRINSFRFDFRAHGESTGIDYEMTPTKEVEDLESTLNMLSKKGFENIVLLGASFGASIISLLDYNKYISVKGLILWYGAIDYLSTIEEQGYFTKEHRKCAEDNGYYEIKSRKTGRTFKLGLPLYNEVYSIVPYKKLIDCELPILFVHGLSDEMVPYQLSESAYKQRKNAKLELIENGKHAFSKDDVALNRAIDVSIDFINEVLK